MNPPAPGWGARTFASFSVVSYRRYFIAIVIMLSGFWMRLTAVGWYVYALTGSAASLGVVAAAALLPFLVFSPLGGALADRVDERRMISRIMYALCAVNLALALLIISGRATYAHVLVYSAVAGSLRGMSHPARNALVVRLVGLDHLRNAIGLNAASFHFTATTGPLLAGPVYHWLGPGACFIGVAVTTLPLAIILPRLEARPREIAPREPFAAQLKGGFAYVATHPATRALMLSAAASIVLVWSFRTLMPAIAYDVLALGELGYSGLMAVIGVGSFAGALWVASGGTQRLHGAKALLPLVLMGSLGVAVAGMATHVLVASAGLVIAGFFHIAFIASTNTQVQLMVSDALRARVMGIWALMFGACWPLGSLWMGAVADVYDTHVAIVLSVAIAVVLIVLLQLTIRHRARRSAVTLPDEASQLDQPVG